MKQPEGLAPVIDLNQARAQRRQAREKIVQAANRKRLGRARYTSWTVRRREAKPPALLTMRHLHLAVAIVRHWAAVDDRTLETAGFRPTRRPVRRSQNHPSMQGAGKSEDRAA